MTTNPSVADRRLTVALLAGVALLKCFLLPFVADFGADGSYYTNIARHLAAGDGFVTDVSVFHQGFRSFPHPSPVYPLWPLLLSVFVKLTSTRIACVVVPTLIWLAALWVVARATTRLLPTPLFAVRGVPVHTGHVALAMLALHSDLFARTSEPYTESLGWLLTGLLLLRAPALFTRLRARDGAELGLFLGLAFLTRSQLVLLTLASLCAIGALVVLARPPQRDLGRTIKFAAVAALVVVALYLPEHFWLRSFLAEPSLRSYFRFDQARVPTALAPVPVMAAYESLGMLLAGWGKGLLVAFTWGHDSSYTRSFATFAYAAPLALVAAIVIAVRRARAHALRADLARAIAWLRDPANAAHVFALSLALGAFVSLHVTHKSFGMKWMFPYRHGAIAALLFVVCFAVLAASGRLGRAACAVLIVTGAAVGVARAVTVIGEERWNAEHGASLTSYRAPLVQFLDEAARAAGGRLVVAVARPEPQRLALHTTHVGYHWLTESTSVADLVEMCDRLGARYVIVVGTRRKLRFLREESFAREFVLDRTMDAPAFAAPDDDESGPAPPVPVRIFRRAP